MSCATTRRIRARLTPGGSIRATIARGGSIAASIDKAVEPLYEGAYNVIPSNQRQVLPSAHHSLLSDIIIEPIPSNYGLITYNGSTITVS